MKVKIEYGRKDDHDADYENNLTRIVLGTIIFGQFSSLVIC